MILLFVNTITNFQNNQIFICDSFLIANAAGKTKRAETKRTPIVGIITEIAKPTGRWKYLILWFIKSKERRYSEIKAFLGDIPQCSHKKQLRELETDGLINRKIYPEVPPRVEYSLTTKGEEFIPIIDLMEEFGRKFGEQVD